MKNKKNLEQRIEALDLIEFAETFRILGKQGLYVAIDDAKKNGMILSRKLTDSSVKYNARCIDLQVLGDQLFTTYAGSDNLRIKEVFTNIINFQDKNEEVNIYTMQKSALMSVMVPEFDEDLFKPYHCDLVLLWFKCIDLKIKQL